MMMSIQQSNFMSTLIFIFIAKNVSFVLLFTQDRENFNKLLGETEDWLYDEGEDQNKQVYLDKLAELKVCQHNW